MSDSATIALRPKTRDFDVVFVADLRFPGGTSTALATEIHAAMHAGLRAAVKPLRSPLLNASHPVHPEIVDVLKESQFPLLGPNERAHGRFVILHHPLVFCYYPDHALSTSADTAVLVLHHPPLSGDGTRQYDPTTCCDTAEILIGTRPMLAPVGPQVREQLLHCQETLLAQDWHNLIDVEAWPDLSDCTSHEKALRIGRHSRPDQSKWPDDRATALAAYPDYPWLEVSMLGADQARLEEKFSPLPAHWDLKPFTRDVAAVKDYLSGLDVWVFYHDSSWVEAFGRAILEAAASGLAVLTSPVFEPLFGAACLYCEPEDVPDTLAELHDSPQASKLQGQRARRHVKMAFGLENFVRRLDALDTSWAKIRAGATRPTPVAPSTLRMLGVPKVMYMSSNGVGLGHITRLLAIAEADPTAQLPLFFTMSRGAGFVREAGFPCEYTPFHRGLNLDLAAWNLSLTQTLLEAVDFYDVGTIVFDGNMPYQGLLDALEHRRHLKSVWCRRGFWREGHSTAMSRGEAFDLILSPGDFAEQLDSGPTMRAKASPSLHVPPIWRKVPGGPLGREAALVDLNLDHAASHVLISLGSQVNFDFEEIFTSICRGVLERGCRPVVLRSPLQFKSNLAELPEGAVALDKYPIERHLAAFDFAVSSAGYNSFHEFTAAGLPTIWVPNEAGEMDRQDQRARFAELVGMGRILRASEALKCGQILDLFTSRSERKNMALNCARWTGENGATQAAAAINLLNAMSPMRSQID